MILVEIQGLLSALAEGKRVKVLMNDDDEYVMDKHDCVSVHTLLQNAKAWHVLKPTVHTGYMGWFKTQGVGTLIFNKKEDAEKAASRLLHSAWEKPIIVKCEWEEEE